MKRITHWGMIVQTDVSLRSDIAARGKARRAKKLRRYDWPWVLLFLGPNLVLFLVFMAFPVFYGLYMSFFKWNIIGTPHFIGLSNYTHFFQDPLTSQLARNSLYYLFGSAIPIVALSLLSAILLNAVTRFTAFWRGIYFLPLVTSPVAAAAVWRWLYAKDNGLVNYFVTRFGVSAHDWLYNTTWAMPSLIIVTIWMALPFNTILYLAGLQEIPRELYEAAEIDGASGWQQFRSITIPLITPTTFFVVLTTIVHVLFGSFDIVNVMTQGGPLNATNTFIYNIYQNAFQFFQFGYASAQSYLLFLVVFVFTLVNWRVQRKWVHY
jgi:multiple sugar transport system permease protein